MAHCKEEEEEENPCNAIHLIDKRGETNRRGEWAI
jgi:hypothetical protein